jgi:hypothetical protein
LSLAEIAELWEQVVGRRTGPYERLTLSAGEIRERAVPRLYDVRLEGLQERIRTVDLAPDDA